MEIQHEVWLFAQAAFNHWAALSTGGGIIATITWVLWWKEKSMKRWCLIPLAILLFILSFFQAWRTQYEDAFLAKQEMEDRKPKLEGFIDQMMVGDSVGPADSPIWLQVSISNTGRTPSFAEAFQLKAISKAITMDGTPLEFKDPYKLTALDAGSATPFTLEHSDLIAEKAINAVEQGHQIRGWAAFTLKGIHISEFGQTNFTFVLSFLDYTGKRIYVTNSTLTAGVNVKFVKHPIKMPGSSTLEDK